MGSSRFRVWPFLVSSMLGMVLAGTVNVASSQLPESWKPYLWLAWLVAAVLAAIVAVLEWRRVRKSGESSFVDGASPDLLIGRVVWNVPLVTATFTGRGTELEAVADVVAGGRAVVLAGQPGVGKSQSAMAYAALHRGSFDVGWWIVAHSRLEVNASLASLAAHLGVGHDDQEAAAGRAIDYLNGTSRWLLVFDNVETAQDLAGVLPSSGGTILITSRDPTISDLGLVVAVEPFDHDEAARFLLERTKSHDDQAAAEIASLVGGLPLALEQAAAYCTQTLTSLAAYLAIYRSPSRMHLWEKGAPVAREPVARTFALAFRAARRRDRASAHLLMLLAFFAPATGVPRSVLRAGARVLPLRLADVVTDPIRLDAALAVLRRMSLIQPDQADGESVQVHPLAQELLRTSIEQGKKRRLQWLPQKVRCRRMPAWWSTSDWIDTAAEALRLALRSGRNPQDWGQWLPLVPHCTAVLDLAAAYGGSPATAGLSEKFAGYLQARGEFTEARRRLVWTVETRRRVLGEEHPNMLSSLGNLAIVLTDLGELDQARQMLERVVEVYCRILGEEHPDTLTSLGNLAGVLTDLGELDQARQISERVVEVYRILGEEHPDTLISLGNLATVLTNLGEFDQARQMLERVVEAHRRILGEEHPDTLISLGNLAMMLRNLGELDQARQMLERVVEAHRRILGEKHPDTLISLRALAIVLRKLSVDHEGTSNPYALHAASPGAPQPQPTLQNPECQN